MAWDAVVACALGLAAGVLVSPVVHPLFPSTTAAEGAEGRWRVEFAGGHLSVRGPGPSRNATGLAEDCFLRRIRSEVLLSKDDVVSWGGSNLHGFDAMFNVSSVWDLFRRPGESAAETKRQITAIIKNSATPPQKRTALLQGRRTREPAPRHAIFGGDAMNSAAMTLCQMAWLHPHIGAPYVLLVGFNENWGGLSTELPCESTDWGHMHAHLRREGCTMRQAMDYVDSPSLLGLFTTQHQHPLLSRPGKTWSIPLGTRHPEHVWEMLSSPPPLDKGGHKSRTMLLSLSNYAARKSISAAVSGNSDNAIRKDGAWKGVDFLRQVRLSKYVLCAAGMGWDTYRAWETLMCGSIPVLKRSAGAGALLHTYGWSPDGNHALPVLWVDDYQEIHPDLLEREYGRIVSRCREYDFGRLAKRWWRDRVLASVEPKPAASAFPLPANPAARRRVIPNASRGHGAG